MVEKRKRWKHLDGKWSYFETRWSPKCWPTDFRFIFIRQKVRKQHREPVQLDLFIPHEHGYDFKVIGNYSPGRSAINSRTHIPVHDVEIFQQNA